MSGTLQFDYAVDFKDYLDELVFRELLAGTATIPECVSVGRAGNVVTVTFTEQPTSGEGAVIDQLVIDHRVLEAKKAKLAAIIRRSEDLITEGFVYDGHLFAFTFEDQLNWISLPTLLGRGLIPIPHSVFVDGALDLYTFTVEADLMLAYDAAAQHKLVTLGSGGALKVQVLAKTTVEGVESVIDNR